MFDYGQALRFGEVQRVLDREGKKKAFNTIMDALNFMEANGWEYLNSYVLSSGGQNQTHEIHYLMRKKEE